MIFAAFFLAYKSRLVAILYPAQMPAKPPTAPSNIEDTEKTLPPQSRGTYAPAKDPIIMPVITRVFIVVFAFLLLSRVGNPLPETFSDNDSDHAPDDRAGGEVGKPMDGH